MNKKAAIIVGLILCLILTGCVRVNTGRFGDIKEYNEVQQYESLDTLEVEIEMGVGELNLKGGAEDLFRGDFIYTDHRWKPMVDYHSSSRNGELSISHPSIKGVKIGGNHRYQWDIALNDEPEIDLDLELGVGKSGLKLSTLNLSHVNIKMGVGEAKIDLSGNWERDLEVNVEGGVGKAVIELPKEMGVYVEVEGGIGSINAKGLNAKDKTFTNDLYGKSDYTMRVGVEAGIGEVVLK